MLREKDFLTLLNWVIKIRIWERFEILLLILVYWYCIPVPAKPNRFLPWFIPFLSWTPCWVVKHRISEKYKTVFAFSQTKYSNELDSSDNETNGPFPRSIIIESNRALTSNLSPFIIEKVISTNLTPITVKKFKKSNFSRWKRGNTLIFYWKWQFHNISVKTYTHKSLNVSKWEVMTFFYIPSMT